MLTLETVDPGEVLAGAEPVPPPAFVLAWRDLTRDRYRGSTPITLRIARPDAAVVGYVVGLDLDGRLEALPDRMVGVLLRRGAPTLNLDELLKALRSLAGGTFRVNVAPVDPLRLSVLPSHGLERFRTHEAHVLEAASPDAAWELVGKDARVAIRKAERDGVKVTVGRDGATLMRYLGLQVTRSARMGGPPFGRHDLDRLRDAFGEDASVAVAVAGGAPVAAALVVRVGAWATLVDTAALPPQYFGAAHMLVTWEAVRHALGAGARTVDLGMLPPDDAAGRRFKEQLGGRRVPIFGIAPG